MANLSKVLAGSPATSCVNFARGIIVLSGAEVQKMAAEALAGTAAGVPSEWRAKQRSRDGDAGHHVTLMTKADVQNAVETLKVSDVLDNSWPAGVERPEPTEAGVLAAVANMINMHPCGLKFFNCGEGRVRDGDSEASFLVVLWPAGAAARRAFGLPARDFHITLGFSSQDIHSKSKGLDSLICASVPSVDAQQLLITAGGLLKRDKDGCAELAGVALRHALASDDDASSAVECAARRLLCEVCGCLARHDDVLSHSECLLQVDAEDEVAQRFRAFALVMLGRYEEALTALESARKLLRRLDEADRNAVEQKLKQAETMCKKRLGKSAGAAVVKQGYAGPDSVATPFVSSDKENYPSTPHLPFSPGVHSDDGKLADCAALLKEEVIITEKLDGGNCCIKNGQVYARTHAQPATHASFSAIKEILYKFLEHDGLEFYGENMSAEHSISYANLTSYFYLFGIRRTADRRWLAWDEVVEFAALLEIPTVPQRFRGVIDTTEQLQELIERWASQSSAVGASTNPEGFVVRRSAEFDHASFSSNIAKYVRANFNQLDGTSKRNWKSAKLGEELPLPAVESALAGPKGAASSP